MKYLAFILLLQFSLGSLGSLSLLAQENATPTPEAFATPAPEPAATATPTPNAEAEFESKIESAVESFFDSKSTTEPTATGAKPKKSGISINIGKGDKKNSPEADQSDNHGISIHVDGDEEGKISEKLSGTNIFKNVFLPVIALLIIFGSPIFLVALILFYRMKKNRIP